MIPSSGLIKTRILIFIKPEDLKCSVTPTILHRVITQKSYNISLIVEKALDQKLQTVGILASKDFHSMCKIRPTLGSVVRAYDLQILLDFKFVRIKLVYVKYIMFHAVFVKKSYFLCSSCT